MNHGLSGYQQGCRCQRCKDCKKAQHRRGTARLDLTLEQRRHCLICGTALAVHPFKACWREVR